jgi:hypothetical protein
MSLATSLRESGMTSARAWLPTVRQIRAALHLNLAAAVDGDELLQHDLEGMPATTMQQALGLVFLTGLVAGLLPTLVNWLLATRAGTATVLVGAAQQLEPLASGVLPHPFPTIVDALQTAAGADPIFPGWLAAFLSALGGWINWPLDFLGIWIVYGIAVLVLAKFFGAAATLQRFYAGTGYAVLPLALLGFGVIPWIGPLIALAGIGFAAILYFYAMRYVTGLPPLQSVLSTVLPPAIAFLLSMVVMLSVALSAVRYIW